MIAIFQREFKSYFNNMLGYVIIAALLALLGFVFTQINISQGYPFFAYSLYGILPYLTYLIPILTMRCLSDERKSKTDQLMLTAPVSVTKIVLGKFLAMVAIFGIPLLFSCIFPIIIYATAGSAHFLNDYTTILAFFLIGVSYISIGMFISSLTESQIISAVLTFGVLYILQVMPGITQYIPKTEGKNALIFVGIAAIVALILYKLIQNAYISFVAFALLTIAIAVTFIVNKTIFYNAVATILNAIPYESSLVVFIYSVFDLTSIITYLSVSVLFVFLTVQSIQKRRYS